MGKTALVTGGSRGIGAACARALASGGNGVIIQYLNSETAAHELAAELGGKAVRADVADSAQVKQMFETAEPIDILVCSAGVSLLKLFTNTTEDEWRKLLDINLGGVINCCQAAIPHMVRQKYGRIVIVSSVWGVVGASCEAVYAASKAALIGLTKSLSKELGPSGITVNCVAPGVIDTDMNACLTPEVKKELTDCTPLGCIGQPEDVAGLVRFLASDEARFITGQVIGVDGGFSG
ncbi:MAG: 3-oxoacyl-ACP reductase FabG [Clostridiales bacterium]|nr:3-oxoacyl-ACP reductase FabG [Clostridiales bacterium]